MGAHKYEDAIVSVSGGIGTIKLNRPKSLNSFGGNLMLDIVAGLRELNEHPHTVFTVITGEGRFVSAPSLPELRLSMGGLPLSDVPRHLANPFPFLAPYYPVAE